MPSRGYTLTELLIVVSLIALAASVALPSLRATDTAQLELVSGSAARAIRFARSEAIRLGAPHGIQQQDGGGRLRVFRLDTDTLPATLVFDVRDPSSRNLYDLQFDTQPFGFDGSFTTTATYRGSCNNAATIIFDGNGTPWCADPTTVLLEQLSIAISDQQGTGGVKLDGLTGRVKAL